MTTPAETIAHLEACNEALRISETEMIRQLRRERVSFRELDARVRYLEGRLSALLAEHGQTL